jgi:hypothetical protein
MSLPRLSAAKRHCLCRGGADAVGRIPHHPRHAKALRRQIRCRQRHQPGVLGDCGAPLYVQVSTRPDLVGIRVSSFDDPSWFKPDADIFVKSAQPWDYMNPAVPKFDTYPQGKAY